MGYCSITAALRFLFGESLCFTGCEGITGCFEKGALYEVYTYTEII